MAGGTSGILAWTVAYPMDTVKSKMQTYEGVDRLRLTKVVPYILKEKGLIRLYRGVHV